MKLVKVHVQIILENVPIRSAPISEKTKADNILVKVYKTTEFLSES